MAREKRPVKITFEIVASEKEADDLAEVVADYLIHVEQIELLNYWVGDE
jgi:hypothetical protein